MKSRRSSPDFFLAGVAGIAVAALLLAGTAVILSALSFHLPGRVQPMVTSSAPLRWSQIESADRATYITNLRAIGCPESVIATVVGTPPATPARQEIARTNVPSDSQLAGIMPANSNLPTVNSVAETSIAPEVERSLPPSSPVSTEAGVSTETLADIPSHREPRALQSSSGLVGRNSAIAARSGIAPVGADTVASGEAPNVQDIMAPDDSVAIPAVFQSPGPNVELTDQQKAQQDMLQREFAKDVINPQNPSLPPSPEKWTAAQNLIDQKFRSLFGYQAFNARKVQENLNPQ